MTAAGRSTSPSSRGGTCRPSTPPRACPRSPSSDPCHHSITGDRSVEGPRHNRRVPLPRGARKPPCLGVAARSSNLRGARVAPCGGPRGRRLSASEPCAASVIMCSIGFRMRGNPVASREVLSPPGPSRAFRYVSLSLSRKIGPQSEYSPNLQ